MNKKGQLLLVSGLLMSITLIAVSSTITHSVNLGAHQGERHDLTPQISAIESNFPLALEYQIDKDDGSVTELVTFDNVSEDFESLFAIRGISLSFTLTSSALDSGTYTFVYEYTLSDGTMTITMSKTTVF
tara:strand:+ start:680 stop:1069 length:390 start_codon:yes stop_codon:yes gene_type:complete